MLFHCSFQGTGEEGSIGGNKKYIPIIASKVSREININGACQLNIFPMSTPIGTPNTREPLTPIYTRPMARPRFSGVEIFEAMVMLNTTKRAALMAEIIRAIMNVQKV